jgi:hypothetical protein
MDDPPHLAPEVSGEVKAALAALDAAIERSRRTHGDPMLPGFVAARQGLVSLQRLLTDAMLTLGNLVERLAAVAEESRQPLSDADFDRLARMAARLTVAHRVRTWVMATGFILVTIGGAAVCGERVGYRWALGDVKVFQSQSADNAAEWLRLMRANPMIRKAVDECKKPGMTVTVADVRRACGVPLYLDPTG